MKAFKITTGLLALALLITACDVEGIDQNVPELTDPNSGTYDKIFDLSTDNSGTVRITPVGTGISKSIVDFGDGTGAAASAVVNAGQSITHVYQEGDYTVSITSIDLSGKETVNTYPLSVIYATPTDLSIGVSGGGLTLTVKPEAKLASGGYKILFGEGATEVPTVIANGASATHTYATAGEYTITVTALSGGAATASTTLDVTVNNPLGLPIDFETPYTNYGVAGVFGGMGMGFVDNPNTEGLNVSNKVLTLSKSVGAETWAGIYIPLGEPGGIPINIDNGKVFKILVYSPTIGTSVHFQLEDGSDYKPFVEVLTTKANKWEELTFDFTDQDIASGYRFTQVVFLVNASSVGNGEVVYLDDITQIN
ncbi:PKD domain-containing protein [Chryseobacterium sp. A321]